MTEMKIESGQIIATSAEVPHKCWFSKGIRPQDDNSGLGVNLPRSNTSAKVRWSLRAADYYAVLGVARNADQASM